MCTEATDEPFNRVSPMRSILVKVAFTCDPPTIRQFATRFGDLSKTKCREMWHLVQDHLAYPLVHDRLVVNDLILLPGIRHGIIINYFVNKTKVDVELEVKLKQVDDGGFKPIILLYDADQMYVEVNNDAARQALQLYHSFESLTKEDHHRIAEVYVAFEQKMGAIEAKFEADVFQAVRLMCPNVDVPDTPYVKRSWKTQ